MDRWMDGNWLVMEVLWWHVEYICAAWHGKCTITVYGGVREGQKDFGERENRADNKYICPSQWWE